MKQQVVVAVILLFYQQEVASQCGGIGNCDFCHFDGSASFQCDKCTSGYILASSTSCQLCPSACSSCDGYSDCASCNSGYYGYRCSSSCNGCLNTKCEKVSGACIGGCDDGFYQNAHGPCYACSANCTKCNNKTICTECLEGLYGDQCNTSCSECVEEVISQCGGIGNCDTCYLDFAKQAIICQKCHGGYYMASTTSCQPCPSSCSSCAGNSDDCATCNPGYYGHRCSSPCDGCMKKECDKGSGACINGCEDGFYQYSYGPCYACSENCAKCSSETICTECLEGFYGDQCNTSCTGCAEVLGSSEQTENDGSFAQGLGAGLGVSFLAVAGIVLALLLRRRWTGANINSEDPSNQDLAGHKEPEESHLKVAPDYQNIAMDNVSSRPSTYQDLNQDRRDGSDYSTIDENTATYCK